MPQDRRTSIQRYEIEGWDYMIWEMEDGEYVKYSDHEAVVSELQLEIDELKFALQRRDEDGQGQ